MKITYRSFSALLIGICIACVPILARAGDDIAARWFEIQNLQDVAYIDMIYEDQLLAVAVTPRVHYVAKRKHQDSAETAIVKAVILPGATVGTSIEAQRWRMPSLYVDSAAL